MVKAAVVSLTIFGGPHKKNDNFPRIGEPGKTRCNNIASMCPVKPCHSGWVRVTTCVTSRFNTNDNWSISASNKSSCGDSAAWMRRIGRPSLRSAKVLRMDIMGVIPTPAAINTNPTALAGGVNPPCGPSIQMGLPLRDATKSSVNTPPRFTVT